MAQIIFPGNAGTSDVMSGKTFSAGVNYNAAGTIPNRAGDNPCLSSAKVGTTLELVPPQGYYDGIDDTVTLGDPNFIANNIPDGVSLFGLVGSNKRNYENTNINVIGTLLQSTTNVYYAGIYGTASAISNNFYTMTGVTKGFYYFATDMTNWYSTLPFYSGMYGFGNSGLVIVSVATGETFRINPAYSVGQSLQVYYRALMCEMVGATTLRIFLQASNSTSSTTIFTQMQEVTVGANFFTSGIYLRDFIDIAYSPSNTFVYQAQTKLNGVLYKF